MNGRMGFVAKGIVAGLAACAIQAQAEDKAWNSLVESAWTNHSRWNPGGAPSGTDTIITPLQYGGMSLEGNRTVAGFVLENASSWAIYNTASSGGTAANRTLTVTGDMVLNMESGSAVMAFRRGGATTLAVSVGGNFSLDCGTAIFGWQNTAIAGVDIAGLATLDTTGTKGGTAQLRFGRMNNQPNLTGGLYMMSESSNKQATVSLDYAASSNRKDANIAFLGGGSRFTRILGNTFADTQATSGTSTLNINGDNGTENTYAGLIADALSPSPTNAAILAINKTGSNIQVLSGEGSYSGATTVNGGGLIIDGDHGGAAGGISVAEGAWFGGGGRVGGSVALADGALLFFDPEKTLTVDDVSVDLGNLSVASLVRRDGESIHWSSVANNRTYKLIDGAATIDAGRMKNLGSVNAAHVEGVTVFFEVAGSELHLVVGDGGVEPPFLQIDLGPGVFQIGSTNLPSVGINYLQATESLAYPDWTNLYWSAGSSSTNWTVVPDKDTWFFRIRNVR